LSDAAKSSPSRKRSERTVGDQRTEASSPEEIAASAGHYRAATQDKLGQALSDLLENPLVTGAIGRAWGAREKAAQAQELWMGALNLPSAADIERLTRRLRSVSQRLEGVEDGVQRLGRTIVQSSGIDGRLQAIEERLDTVSEELQELREAVLGLAGATRAEERASATASAPRARAARAPARSKARTKR
jgi:tetrahydromethanopterin S-methyltransferase subunit G